MIDVREYEMTDYFDVSRILKEAFDVSKANVNPDDNYKELVATIDNKPVGYLVLTKVLDLVKGKPYFLVDYVCVDSNYRNLGIGYKLMDKVLEIASSYDGLYIELTSKRERVAAHHLYEKAGYVRRDSFIYRRVLQ